MAANFNKVILAGRLGRDPEIRYVGSGEPVTKFSLAVNPNKRDAKPEDTLWVDIVAWSKLAETCNTYLKKGSNVLVEGRLVVRKYDDKNGDKRTATEIVINSMQMLDGKRDDSSEGYNGGARSSNDRGGGRIEDELADEIPF